MREIDTTFTTIVSLLPYKLTEYKPGLNPAEYIINPQVNGTPGLTIIPNNAFYLVNTDPLADAKEVRSIKVPVPSRELADSIINDYTSGLLAVEAPDAFPGLFALKGDYDEPKLVMVKFAKEMAFFRDTQIHWFERLIAIADDTWSKSHSPIAISSLERDACRMLGYKRDWLNPIPLEVQEKCPFCQNPINSGAIKCVTCGEVLDKKKYAELVGA